MAAGALLCAAIGSLAAQNTETQFEAHKLIRANDAIGALGPNLFGDEVNFYNGALSFSAVDLDLPGNDELPMRIGRKFSVESVGPIRTTFLAGNFGDWDLDLPMIHGVFSRTLGFVVTGFNPEARCSAFEEPPPAPGFPDGSFVSSEYWSGTHLYVPGKGDQEILARNGSNTLAPGGNTAAYPLVTRDHWQIGCSVNLQNAAGEGYMVVAPNGLKYRFDWLTYREVPGISKPKGSISTKSVLAPENHLLPRKEARIYPTQITDRFGNSVNLNWLGNQLRSMTASDGRSITLTYVTGTDRVATVTDGTRIWRYSYDANNHLDRVTQPDGSAWSFDLMPLFHASVIYSGSGQCTPGILNSTTFTGTITHPSGAIGSFSVKPQRHGRTHVPYACIGLAEGAGYLYEPDTFDTLAITQKQISGPGLPAINWAHTYSDPRSCFVQMPRGQVPPRLCAIDESSTKTVTVTEPGNTFSRYTFGTRYGVDEGRLKTTERGSGGAVLQTSRITYASPAGHAFPDPVGFTFNHRGDSDFSQRIYPELERKTTISGRDYVWSAGNWDQYGNPIAVVRSSGMNSKREALSYHYNTTHWVLGLTDQVIDTTGTVAVTEVDLDYDGNALPISQRLFGRTHSTMTYCNLVSSSCAARGLLLTVADGAGKTTTFTNHKRGIPQNVRFADGSSISGAVNGQGWVTSFTDELGFTTTYDFDPMGRLARIVQPGGDSTNWAPTEISFASVPSVEYGVGAGHWKQSISIGRYRKETVFDALWRPVVTREWDSSLGGDRFVQRAFDHEGRTIFQSFPAASSSATTRGERSAYDAIGRLQRSEIDSEQGLLTTNISYDALSNRKRISNPRGRVTTIEYLQYDSASEDSPTYISSPEGVTVMVTRDRWGKPTNIVRSGNSPAVSATRHFVYDPNQRLCKTIEPERGAEVLHYDSANRIDWSAKGQNLTSTTLCQDGSVLASARISRNYDARDRLTRINYPDATLDEFRSYYADGALYSIARGTSTDEVKWEYQYNKRRLLTSERVYIGGQNAATTRSYDNMGGLSEVSHLNGFALQYSPNAFGQPTRVYSPTRAITYASNVSYYPNGAMSGFTYGNGAQHTMTKNARDLPARSRDVMGSSTLVDHSYGYDQNGNPVSVDDLLNLDDKTMSYDGLDRLRTATGGFGSASMSYDGLDNLTQYQAPGRDYRYVIDSGTQRLSRINNIAGSLLVGFSYDARGNVTQRTQSGNALGFAYDLAERVTSTTRNGGLIASYKYDGHGRRIRTDKANGDIRFQIYNKDGEFQWENDASFSTGMETHVNYVRLNGSLIAKQISETPFATTTSLVGGDGSSDDVPVSTLDVADVFGSPFNDPEAIEVVAGTEDEARGDVINARITTYRVQYVHTDALGSPIAETNSLGQLINGSRTLYEPCGQPLNTPREGAPSYTGHQFDVSTGMIYAQQRYYDPMMGRFLSTDPMAVDANNGWNFNRYNYAANSPYKFTDPDGRAADWISYLSGDTAEYSDQRGAAELMYQDAANRKISDDLKPFTRTAEAIDSAGKEYGARTSLNLEGGIAVAGIGVSGTTNLVNGKDSVSFTPRATGAQAGLMAETQLVSFQLPDSVDTPVAFTYELSGGSGVAGGFKISLDPGGTITASVKYGVGVGAFSNYLPQGEIEEELPAE